MILILKRPQLFRLSTWYLRMDLPSGIHVDRSESVQKNFLLFALRSLNWDASLILPSYSSRLLLINLPTLANRGTMLGTFLYPLLVV